MKKTPIQKKLKKLEKLSREINAMVKAMVIKLFTQKFGNYPIQVGPSMDGSGLSVYVYDVEPEKIDMMDDYIQGDLEKKLFPNGEEMFMSMVKSIEITKEYYPKYHRGQTTKTPIQ